MPGWESAKFLSSVLRFLEIKNQHLCCLLPDSACYCHIETSVAFGINISYDGTDAGVSDNLCATFRYTRKDGQVRKGFPFFSLKGAVSC